MGRNAAAASRPFTSSRKREPAGLDLHLVRRPSRRGGIRGSVRHQPARRLVHHVAHAGVSGGSHQRAVGGQLGDQGAEGLLHVVEIAIDVGVIELDGREQQRCARRSAGTSASCRRRPCRTRRLPPRSAALPRRGSCRRSSPRCRRRGAKGRGPSPPAATPRGSWWWSCRGCRPRPPDASRPWPARRAHPRRIGRECRNRWRPGPRDWTVCTAFPITTRSGRWARTFSARKPCATGMPQPASDVLMGG